jgi:hypothetical protein
MSDWRTHVGGYLASGNVRELEKLVTSDENVLFAVVAASGGLGTAMGLLALTDRRLLYVKERVLRSPKVLELPLEEMESVAVVDSPAYGALTVSTPGAAYHWDSIKPRGDAAALARVLQGLGVPRY